MRSALVYGVAQCRRAVRRRRCAGTAPPPQPRRPPEQVSPGSRASCCASLVCVEPPSPTTPRVLPPPAPSPPYQWPRARRLAQCRILVVLGPVQEGSHRYTRFESMQPPKEEPPSIHEPWAREPESQNLKGKPLERTFPAPSQRLKAWSLQSATPSTLSTHCRGMS